ncbi:hypothetical protein EDD22DRAFT_27429 [Suillus occidentalis]|nr:hypothetical protein EDD22DRAFT_27429 [Suillus occidentalis]
MLLVGPKPLVKWPSASRTLNHGFAWCFSSVVCLLVPTIVLVPTTLLEVHEQLFFLRYLSFPSTPSLYSTLCILMHLDTSAYFLCTCM